MGVAGRRIAINVGAGYVPGLHATVMAVATAAHNLGWETVGIRDGFDGILRPERHPEGGLLQLTPRLVEDLDPSGTGLLGQSAQVDPFHVRQVSDDGMVEEVDMSGRLLAALDAERIEALVSIVGGRGLTILHKLNRKGLTSVCVPLSIENDIEATAASFGFNSVLTFTIEMLDRAREAARSARKIAVVEVLGRQAGWLALQAGIAARADAVLIPEIPCDLSTVASSLRQRGRPYGLVVVAEGASLLEEGPPPADPLSLKGSLSPLAETGPSDHVIQQSGRAAEMVASRLQLLLAEEVYPLVLGNWARGGTPTAVDRQLGMAYGAASVRGLASGETGSMVAFVPPHLTFVPLAAAINRTRTVRADGEFVQIAHSLGISLGEAL